MQDNVLPSAAASESPRIRAGTVLRAVLIVAAVVCARLAQHAGDSSLVPAWVVVATLGSIVLAALAWPSPLPASTPLVESAGEPGRAMGIGAAILLIPTLVAAFIWCQEDFHVNQEFVNGSSSWAAGLWLAAIVAGLAFLWTQRALLGASTRGTLAWPLVLAEILVLIAIVELAAGLRVWHLASLPEGIWYDEADSSAAAQRMLAMPFQPLLPGTLGHVGSLYFYVMACLTDLFGMSIGPIRLASALFGTVGVVAVYLLGRKVGGAPYGLCAAILLATSRWAIDFSRIALPDIAAPAIIGLGFTALAVAMWRPNGFWFAITGVALGISLLTYQGAVTSGILVAFIVIAVRLLTDSRFRTAAWPGVLLLVVGIVVGAAPILTVLHLDPAYTLARVNQVSLFTEYSRWPDRIQNLLTNLRLHLYMFTVQGDANGRHNLPGAPMLDPITGSLFLLGLGICIKRLGTWYYQLLLLWLGASVASGVLSLSYEAPQSARVVGAVAPIALIAALPLVALAQWLWDSVRFGLRNGPARVPLARSIAVLLVVLVPLGISAHDNYESYFVLQTSDVAAWHDMGGLQAVIGRSALALQSRGYTVRTTPDLAGDPALRLAAGGQDLPVYDPDVPVPLPVPAIGLALIIPATSNDVLNYVMRSYPSAHGWPITPHADPKDVEANAVVITPSDAVHNMGISATFGSGRAQVTQEHAVTPVPWPPWAGPTTAATLRASMTLSAAQVAFPVEFRVAGLAKGTLSIDNAAWPISGQGTPAVELGAGNHALVINGSGKTGGTVSLEWRSASTPWQPIPSLYLEAPSIPTGGLLGVYYSTPDFQGTPAFLRVDQFVNTYYQNAPDGLSFPFSVRWLGSVQIKTAGTYQFSLDSTGPAALYLDGRRVLSSANGVATTALAAGAHTVRLDYQATGSYLHCYLRWTTPGQAGVVPIPPDVTLPAHL